MSTITGTVNASCVNAGPYSCSHIGCDSQQWIGEEHCHTNGNYYCCGFNPNVCPVINKKIQGSPSLINSANCDRQGTCPVTCTYPLDQFTNTADIESYRDYFVSINSPFQSDIDTYNNQLLPAFCQQAVTTCPPNPTTNRRTPFCSRMTSNGKDGIEICSKWYNDSNYLQASDSAKQGFCSVYSSAAECQCVLRNQNEVYQQINQDVSNYINPGCWWSPCRNRQQYLVTSDINTNNCPTTINVCDQIINVVNQSQGAIDVNVAKQYIKCGFNTGPSGCTGPSCGNTGNTGTTGPTGGQQSFISKYLIWIIGGIIILVVIIITIIIIAASSNKPKVSASYPKTIM